MEVTNKHIKLQLI